MGVGAGGTRVGVNDRREKMFSMRVGARVGVGDRGVDTFSMRFGAGTRIGVRDLGVDTSPMSDGVGGTRVVGDRRVNRLLMIGAGGVRAEGGRWSVHSVFSQFKFSTWPLTRSLHSPTYPSRIRSDPLGLCSDSARTCLKFFGWDPCQMGPLQSEHFCSDPLGSTRTRTHSDSLGLTRTHSDQVVLVIIVGTKNQVLTL